MPPEKIEYGSTASCFGGSDSTSAGDLLRAAAAVQCIAASVRANSLDIRNAKANGNVHPKAGITVVALETMPSLEKCPAVVLRSCDGGGGGGENGSEVSSVFDESTSLLKGVHKEEEEERWYVFLAQVFPSFMLAGLGMVAAGLLLDKVQTWPAFVEASELFILVPALLGLKGNLEMTLASRLATQANLGKAESWRDIVGLALGNMALLQCQSVVVGTLASLYAIVTSLALTNDVTMRTALLVLASSVATAATASLVLGGVMIVVVLVSRPCRINPDNVAIPVAAALGDLTTLGLLALISAAFYDLKAVKTLAARSFPVGTRARYLGGLLGTPRRVRLARHMCFPFASERAQTDLRSTLPGRSSRNAAPFTATRPFPRRGSDKGRRR